MWEFQRFCFPFTLLTSNGNSYQVVFSRVILIKMMGGGWWFCFWNIRNSGYKLLGSKEWERLIQDLLKMHACLHGFSEDYEEKSTRICSLLQHDVTNPMWHPFKKEFVDGKFKYFLILIFIYELFSPCQSC
jgi:hypothetical protein